MTDKTKILKQTVEAKTRTISAKWSFEDIPDRMSHIKPVKDMSVEEQADEIVRRLSQPYKTFDETLTETLTELSKMISEEIDNEIIEELKAHSDKSNKRST